MNQTIKKIKDKLSNYQDVKILEEKENSITIQPDGENTFPLTFIADNKKFDVYFQGWHQEFAEEADALDCFAFGLSDDCRLKVISAGDIEYKWILEVKENEQWIEDSITSLALFPIWHKEVITYLQNNIINR
jgi:hypothetical protein